MLGPVLSKDFSDPVQIVQSLLSGKAPGLPRLGFNIVDVHDVADLHIRAMTDLVAAGQKFIAAGDFAWMADIAAILNAQLGDQAAKVPTAKAQSVLGWKPRPLAETVLAGARGLIAAGAV